MASTYGNDLRLEEIGDGEQSGTWGATTNTNLELIAEALSFGTEAITTNADTHTTTIADGATDPGRSLYLKYTGTLDSTCTITIAPNSISKTWYIENGTSGSQSIIISQGSGANVTIPTGQTKVVYSDGAGSGAAMAEIGTLGVTNLNVSGDITVGDDLTVSGDIVVSGTVDGVDLQTLNNAVTANTAKTGITTSQANAITANTAKTGITTSQANAITANTAKTTNATHTGEVTGSGALTIANNVVDEANLKVSNSPTNGYFLSAQSGNTGGLTWAEAGGGGTELLATLTASNSTTLSFTGFDASAYSSYVFKVDLKPVSANVTLRARVSTDGGSSYLTSSTYYTDGATRAYMELSPGGGATAAQNLRSGDITLIGAGNTNNYTLLTSLVCKGGDDYTGMTSTNRNSLFTATTVVNGIQFYLASGPSSGGNFSSGTIHVYGFNK